MSAASVARRQRELENGNMRLVALEQVEDSIASTLAEIDSNLFIVRTLLHRNELLKLRLNERRSLAGQIEARGRRRAA